MSTIISRVLSYKFISHARQRHRCIWCGEDIKKNSSYIKYAEVSRGFHVLKFHIECYEMCYEAVNHGIQGFFPGSYFRGTDINKIAEAYIDSHVLKTHYGKKLSVIVKRNLVYINYKPLSKLTHKQNGKQHFIDGIALSPSDLKKIGKYVMALSEGAIHIKL